MRDVYLDVVAEQTGDELLTTGEAAKLMSVSRQHVVDLCNSGELLYTTVGRHRRVRRSDVEQVLSQRRRLTADQLRSLLFAYVVAGRLVSDPQATVTQARINLERMRAANPRGTAAVWLNEWARLLDAPLADLLAALTSPSLHSRELRQNSPFAGVLSDEERQQVLATARLARKAATA